MSESISHRLAIIEEFSGRLAAGTRLLDLGCGAGDDVAEWRSRGFDAMGCDVLQYADSSQCTSMYASGLLRLISLEPYRIPFNDGTFDVVVSNQVFEHVRDYPAAIQESRRVLKPGGVALHVFPPRWRLIEPHVFVPLAGVLQGLPWLRLWAQLGIRNEYQGGMNAARVAQLNRDYLRDHTNYLSTKQLRLEFERHFKTVRFAEDVYLRHSPSGKARALYKLVNMVPPIRRGYSLLRQRVVVVVND